MMKKRAALVLVIAVIFAASSSMFARQTPEQQSPPQQAGPATPPAAQAPAPPPYQPKSPNIPARSDSEDLALRYMLVVIRAEKQFNKQYNHYALTLTELVHSGSFTKRMVNPERGDYTASYKGKKDSYVLTMTPKLLDAQHRSFYAEDDGKIHADETKAADKDSPVVK